jgi:hypothetical protein
MRVVERDARNRVGEALPRNRTGSGGETETAKTPRAAEYAKKMKDEL